MNQRIIIILMDFSTLSKIDFSTPTAITLWRQYHNTFYSHIITYHYIFFNISSFPLESTPFYSARLNINFPSISAHLHLNFFLFIWLSLLSFLSRKLFLSVYLHFYVFTVKFIRKFLPSFSFHTQLIQRNAIFLFWIPEVQEKRSKNLQQ